MWCFGSRAGSRAEPEAGSATIWVLAGCLLLGSVAVIPVGRSEIAVTRHRAAVAADLTALAGARLVSVDAGAACTLAGRVAAANGSRLLACRAVACSGSSGASLQVETAVPLPGFARAVQPDGARAVARAGPAGCVGRSGSGARYEPPTGPPP